MGNKLQKPVHLQPLSTTVLTMRPAASHTVLIRNSGAEPLDNRGNVDTAIVQCGFGLVADGVGHHYAHMGPPADKRAAMSDIWAGFSKAQAEWPVVLSVEALNELVRAAVSEASGRFERLGKSSSLSCCFIAKCGEGRLWGVCFSIADSVLVLVRGEEVLPLSSSTNWQMEIGGDVRGLEGYIHEIQAGDVILGLTDGIVDAMRVLGKPSDEDVDVSMGECCRGVQAVLKGRVSELGVEAMLLALFEASLGLVREGVIESDDCSSFAMVV